MIRPDHLVSVAALIAPREPPSSRFVQDEPAESTDLVPGGLVGSTDLAPGEYAERDELEHGELAPGGWPAVADRPASLPPRPRPAGWRTGWPALLASSAARSVLALLLGLLLSSTVPALAGWQPSVVQTGSMQPTLHPGDVVVARPVPAARLRPGQVVLADDPDRAGRLRLHRLIRLNPDGSLVLRGDANPAPDSSPVPAGSVRGVAALRVPALGLPALWWRQGRYPVLGLLGLLLGCLLLLATAYRPDPASPAPVSEVPATKTSAATSPAARSPAATSPAATSPAARSPAATSRGRRRPARAAATIVLAGLAALQLAHPASAQARFTAASTDSGDTWAAASYFSCRQVVLASNPVLYYRLDEASGSTVTDSSGAGATGTFSASGVTLRRPGACGYDGGTAITLNGSSGYLYRNSQSSAPSTFSWELWFATSTTRGGWLIGMGSSQTGQSSTTDRQLYLTSGGAVEFGILSNNKMKTVLSATGYNDGSWHLADATFSASTGMRLYLDGLLVASNASVTSAKNYSGYLRIGYDNLTGWDSAPPSNFFAGSIDEVSAYASVLTAAQIGSHYATGS